MSQLHFAVLDFGVSHLTTREIKEKLPGIKRVGLVDQRLKKLPALMQTGWDDCSKFAEHILAAARQAVDPAPATRFRPQVFVFSLDASEELLREAMGPQVICAFTATAADYHSRMHAMHQLDMVSGLIDGLQRCSSNDPTSEMASDCSEVDSFTTSMSARPKGALTASGAAPAVGSSTSTVTL